MSTIIKLFKAWRAGTLAQTMAQLGLNAAMLANPLTWVAVAIAAVVAIGVALYLNWEKITKTAKKLYKTVTKCFKKIGKNIMEAMQPVFDFFGSLMDAWDKFTKSLEDFKMPKIGIPKALGGDGFIQTEKSTKKKGKKKAIGGVIPYDNYPALLHRGEKVQTQQEVNQDKRQQGGNTYQFGNIIIQGSGNSKQDAKSILNAIVAEIEMVGGAGA